MGVLLEALFGLSEAGGGPCVAVVVLLADGGQEVVVQKVGGRGQAKVPAESLQEQKFCGEQLLLGEGEVMAAQDPCTVYLIQFGHTVFSVLKLTYGSDETGTRSPVSAKMLELGSSWRSKPSVPLSAWTAFPSP